MEYLKSVLVRTLKPIEGAILAFHMFHVLVLIVNPPSLDQQCKSFYVIIYNRGFFKIFYLLQ